MKVTEYRTMLYLPNTLYKSSVAAAKKQKKSLAALIRDALALYLKESPKQDKWASLQAGFGLWKDRQTTGVEYENNMRAQWKRHG